MMPEYSSPKPNDCQHGVNLDDDCKLCMKAKIADLERQLEEEKADKEAYQIAAESHREDALMLDNYIDETIALKAKLAEAIGILEDIVTLPPRTGTWTIADIQELAQEYLNKNI